MSERLYSASEGSSDDDDNNKKKRKSDKGESGASTTGVAAKTEGAAPRGQEKLTPAAANLAQLLAKREREKHPLEGLLTKPEEKPKAEEKPAEAAEGPGKVEEAPAKATDSDTKSEEEAARPAVTAEGAEEFIEETPVQQPEAEKADEAVESEELAQIESDEKPEVARQLTTARLEQVRAEQQTVEPESTESQAVEASIIYLEAVDRQVEEGKDLEVATADAFSEVTGVEAPPMPEEQNQYEATEPGLEDQAAGTEQPAVSLEAVDFPRAQTDEARDEEDSYAAAYAAGYTAGGARGGWGGGAVPGSIGSHGAEEEGAGTGVTAGRWNSWNKASREPRVEVSGVASGLLVGGIVGYLLGRRRGRIRSERQLIPLQQKLEKQVQALSDHLAIREAQVRKLVWERAAVERIAPAVAASEAVQVTSAHEQVRKPASATERVQPATAKPEKRAEAAKPKPEVKARDLPLRQVLDISETIVVGSTTIRRVFETNLIEEAGLRRIVHEHLQGGDVRKILTEELMIKELSYERDPLMNARPDENGRTSSGAPATVGGAVATAAGNPLLQQTPANAPPTTVPTAAPPTSQPQIVTPALVMANIVALGVLAVLLIALLIIWLTR